MVVFIIFKLKFEVEHGFLHRGEGDCRVNVDHHGALLSGGLLFFLRADGEGVVGHFRQGAAQLDAVGSKHLHGVAYILEILPAHLEGGGKAG